MVSDPTFRRQPEILADSFVCSFQSLSSPGYRTPSRVLQQSVLQQLPSSTPFRTHRRSTPPTCTREGQDTSLRSQSTAELWSCRSSWRASSESSSYVLTRSSIEVKASRLYQEWMLSKLRLRGRASVTLFRLEISSYDGAGTLLCWQKHDHFGRVKQLIAPHIAFFRYSLVGFHTP